MTSVGDGLRGSYRYTHPWYGLYVHFRARGPLKERIQRETHSVSSSPVPWSLFLTSKDRSVQVEERGASRSSLDSSCTGKGGSGVHYEEKRTRIHHASPPQTEEVSPYMTRPRSPSARDQAPRLPPSSPFHVPALTERVFIYVGAYLRAQSDVPITCMCSHTQRERESVRPGERGTERRTKRLIRRHCRWKETDGAVLCRRTEKEFLSHTW